MIRRSARRAEAKKKKKALAEHLARHPEDVGRTVEDFNWILQVIVRPAAEGITCLAADYLYLRQHSAPSFMSFASAKPLIFISYAHADEPEKPRGEEIQWLTFVMKFLRPAVKGGEFTVWV